MEALGHTAWMFVQQAMEPLEIVFGLEMANHYVIYNDRGAKMFVAAENGHVDVCSRLCCRSDRSFHISIFDDDMNPVLHLKRPCHCYCCCFPFLMDVVYVYDSRHIPIGSVRQRCSLCYPKLDILLPNGERKLHILGQFGAVFKCFSDVNFMLMSPDQQIVGQIKRHYPGFFKELFTNADIFGVWYPLTLNVHERALVLAATILIDFEYFENK